MGNIQNRLNHLERAIPAPPIDEPFHPLSPGLIELMESFPGDDPKATYASKSALRIREIKRACSSALQRAANGDFATDLEFAKALPLEILLFMQAQKRKGRIRVSD